MYNKNSIKRFISGLNASFLSFFIYFLVAPLALFAQQTTTDSLLLLLQTAPHDTTKLNLLFELVENIYDAKLWQPYNEQALKLAKKLSLSNDKKIKAKGKKGLADGFNNIGFLYNNQGQIKEALDYFGRSLKIQEEIGDKQGIANSLVNIGYLPWATCVIQRGVYVGEISSAGAGGGGFGVYVIPAVV